MENETNVDPFDIVNNQLDNAKNKYVSVVVLGYMPNGKLGIDTTVPNYGFLHATFNEAVMELLLHKRDSMVHPAKEPAEMLKEAAKEIVLEAAPKKKGRPKKEPA